MKWWWFLLAGLGLLFIIGLVILIIWLVRRNPSEPSDTSTSGITPRDPASPPIPIMGQVATITDTNWPDPATMIKTYRDQLVLLAGADYFPETLIAPLTAYRDDILAYTDRLIKANDPAQLAQLAASQKTITSTSIALQNVLTNVEVRKKLADQLKTATNPTQVANLTQSIALKDKYIKYVLQEYIVKDVLGD